MSDSQIDYQEIASNWLKNDDLLRWWEGTGMSPDLLPKYLQMYQEKMGAPHKSKAQLREEGGLSEDDLNILGEINIFNALGRANRKEQG